MELRKQPTRRCKAKTGPEDVQWEDENVATFPDNFELPELPVPCSSKSSPVLQNGKCTRFEYLITKEFFRSTKHVYNIHHI